MDQDTILWPGHAKCAVMFTIHVDGDSIYNGDRPLAPRTESYGAYGPQRAVDRLLDLCEDKNIPCTYFIPGQIMKRYPTMARNIDSCGHEIGFHGYDHEDHMYTDRPTESWIQVIKKSQAVFEDVIGKRAIGYCATSSDFQSEAPEIWHNMGFQYSSSMRGDDRPYRWDFGKGPTDFIEIPARWELDDYPQFSYSFYPAIPSGQDRIAAYRGVFKNWHHEFLGYYRYGLCMVFMLHPHIIGTPGKLRMLRQLMDEMKMCPDVWLATGGEIAGWWRQNY